MMVNVTTEILLFFMTNNIIKQGNSKTFVQ